MDTPESLEVIKQRIAHDPQVQGFLHLAMRAGLLDVEQEFALAEEVSTRYGVSMETFSEGCDIARHEIDEAILNGTLPLL